MRSIANGESEKVENQIETVPLVQPGSVADGAEDPKDSTDNQEESMVAAETSEATRQAVLGLLAHDPQARDLYSNA
jgi:hypothetical protein